MHTDGHWVIYADGALEDQKGTWGALAHDPVSGRKLVFAGKLPACLIGFWLEHVGEQLVCVISGWNMVENS